MHLYTDLLTIIKEFSGQFSECLSCMIPCCDSLVILDDFNIHICCPDKPLVQDFFSVVGFFQPYSICSGLYAQVGSHSGFGIVLGCPGV